MKRNKKISATGRRKGPGRRLTAPEKLELSRRRSRLVELAAGGKDLRECEELLKLEGFAHTHFSTLSRDLKRERDRLSQATLATVKQHRDQLTKNLLALEAVVRERGLQHDDYVPHLLQIWNQLARLVGANADQRVTVAVETTDPKKMKLYQRFLWESRGVEEADFEKVWQLLAKLAKPLGVVDSECLPPRQDDDAAN
jgi:hypothetical protein